MDVLRDYLRAHAVEIVQTVKAGKYKPQPVRRVMIPTEEKGKFRALGIPTAVDRVIQQAIAQRLSEEYEPVFSTHSHGFRSNRSCQTAINEALEIANQGTSTGRKFSEVIDNHPLRIRTVGGVEGAEDRKSSPLSDFWWPQSMEALKSCMPFHVRRTNRVDAKNALHRLCLKHDAVVEA